MEILTAMQTKNRCYQSRRSARHVGILVHSTGAVNRELRRYVDAPELLGKNQYNNHWNQASTDKCMHAFVGYDKDKRVVVVQTLPYEYACWGCGRGTRGSYNYDPTAHIQFEICQGSNTDGGYYAETIRVAAEYCAYLCRLYGWTADDIVSHREAACAGYASNHGDPESWMRCFGDDMTQFRARVAALIEWRDAAGPVVPCISNEAAGDTAPAEQPSTDPAPAVPVSQAVVYSQNKGPVRIRAQPSKSCALWKLVPCGTEVQVLETDTGSPGWWRIRYRSRDWYMQTQFLSVG